MYPKFRAFAAVTLAFLAASFVALAQARTEAEYAAITRVLMAEFDRPESPLAVAPVVVVGNHAIAGWVQNSRGGRALLRQIHGKWTIHLCSGDALTNADMLESTGIPSISAKALSQSLAEAERAMPAATLALFATFEGVVHIGTAGLHPPVRHAAPEEGSKPLDHSHPK